MMIEKWVIYAVAAAICWGASYAASGPVLQSGMDPITFYFCFSLFGSLAAFVGIIASGKVAITVAQITGVGSDLGWLVLSLTAAALGGMMTYMAIGEKNATLASLIEISYPFFVVIFSWIFFQDVQLNMMTLGGAFLVISGVAMILLNSK